MKIHTEPERIFYMRATSTFDIKVFGKHYEIPSKVLLKFDYEDPVKFQLRKPCHRKNFSIAFVIGCYELLRPPRWVLNVLTDRQRTERVRICKENLTRFR